MTEPNAANPTGVESYDHGRVAHLQEYHDARKALDALVKRINRDEIDVGQAVFLQMSEQMAASLSYSDSSAHPDNGCPARIEGAWPYEAVLSGEGDDLWLAGKYRCAFCGAEWTMNYAIDLPNLD